MSWIKFSDKLPEEGQYVIINEDGPYVDIYRFSVNMFGSDHNYGIQWQPMYREGELEEAKRKSYIEGFKDGQSAYKPV